MEFLDNEIRLLEPPSRGPGFQAHTNHFLHPDFVSRDALNVFARNSSLLRLKACEAGLAELTGPGSPVTGGAGRSAEEHFALLARPRSASLTPATSAASAPLRLLCSYLTGANCICDPATRHAAPRRCSG